MTPNTPDVETQLSAGQPLPPGASSDGLTPELRAARDGEMIDEAQERRGLQHLLAPESMRLFFKISVEVDFPGGREAIVFSVQQLDPATLEKLERESTRADGSLDTYKFNCHVVGEATLSLKDAHGMEVSTGSPQWVTGIPGKAGFTTRAAAIDFRFKYQGGLIDALNARVQQISGYDGTRVGVPQRSMVEAGKG